MQLLDGRKISEELLDSLKAKAQELNPCLTVVSVGEDPASKVYIRQKKLACEKVGIRYQEICLEPSVTQVELISKIEELNEDKSVTGLIVQLPVPEHLYVPDIIKAINPKKDVDGFHAYNLGKMFLSPDFEDLPPATPSGIIRMLDTHNIDVKGMEAVVVGHSNIVGKPISTMLLNRNATVTTCHIDTKDLKSHTQRADLIVVAVGKAGLITEDMVKEGVIIVDVGINRLKDGSLAGDVDFENVSKKASYISPVPGGVGPMTVASLIANVVTAAERQK